jgi:hypothetical protein
LEIDKIISGLSTLDALYNGLMRELINTYHLDEISDVRVNLVKHPRIVISSTLFIFIVRQDNLFNSSWWERIISNKKLIKGMTEKDRRTFAHAFDQYIESAYITMLLFGLESEFRFLYVDIFGKNPPIKFSEVYKKLFREFGLSDYDDLLRLASNIRNSLHNNGKFIWPDDPVTWRDKKYEFKQGQSLKMDYWKTFIIITTDVLLMLEKLIKSTRIIQKHEIKDSSYE